MLFCGILCKKRQVHKCQQITTIFVGMRGKMNGFLPPQIGGGITKKRPVQCTERFLYVRLDGFHTERGVCFVPVHSVAFV